MDKDNQIIVSLLQQQRNQAHDQVVQLAAQVQKLTDELAELKVKNNDETEATASV